MESSKVILLERYYKTVIALIVYRYSYGKYTL